MSYTHPSMHATNPIAARDTFATPASPDEKALFDMLRTITRPSDHSTLMRPGTNSYHANQEHQHPSKGGVIEDVQRQPISQQRLVNLLLRRDALNGSREASFGL